MRPIKLLASVMAILTGMVGAYDGYVSPAPEEIQLLITLIGVVLIIDSLACFYGANIAFAASAILSGIFLLSAFAGWGGGYSSAEWVALVAALVNIIMGVMAFRSSATLPEQANPLNLPVFG